MKTKKMIKRGKVSLAIKNVLGILLIVVSFLPVVTFSATWDSGYSNIGTTYFGPGMDNPYGLPDGSILDIASNLLFWLLSLFAIAGIIGFVLSGIFYLISAGDEDMVKRGKDGMKWSIIGILVGLSGFVIMQALNAFLGGASKSF